MGRLVILFAQIVRFSGFLYARKQISSSLFVCIFSTCTYCLLSKWKMLCWIFSFQVRIKGRWRHVALFDQLFCSSSSMSHIFLADPGEARGCSTNTSVIQWLFVKISLRRCHAPMVEDGAFSHKIDYVTICYEILNPEGHPNWTTGSIVTAILLNRLILPISGATAAKGLRLQSAQQACF